MKTKSETQIDQQHLEIKLENEQAWVRIAVLPHAVITGLATHPGLDRARIRTMRVCCYNFEEYIEREHFLSLMQN